MINIHNLAGRIANLYYDYDYYDFNDSLEVGETMEDAIFKIERVLSGKGGVDSYIDFMDEIIDNIEWEQTEDPSGPDYGEDMLNRAMDIRDDLYSLKDSRLNTNESYKRRVSEGIKLNSVKKASVQGYDEYARIKMPRGFCDCSVYLKDRDSNNFAFQVSEIHPYDEADYVWAQARNGIIKFVQGNKVVATMQYDKGDTCEEVLEKAIGVMRDLNKDVEPTKAIW